MSERIVRVSKEGDEIVIRANISELMFLAENHPEYPFKVHNANAFGDALVKKFQRYSTQNEVEKGSLHIEECFEDILYQVSEDGHDFIEIIELK